jgi:hypothetical protein
MAPCLLICSEINSLSLHSRQFAELSLWTYSFFSSLQVWFSKVNVEKTILRPRIEVALEIMRRARTQMMKMNVERKMARRKPRHNRRERQGSQCPKEQGGARDKMGAWSFLEACCRFLILLIISSINLLLFQNSVIYSPIIRSQSIENIKQFDGSPASMMDYCLLLMMNFLSLFNESFHINASIKYFTCSLPILLTFQ